MATKIKYVQLEPAEVLLDFHTSRMTAEQFGCYWLIMMHLYCEGGRLDFDIEQFSLLCNCTKNFDRVWEKIESKFQKKDGCIRHKRVSKELRQAKRRRQVAMNNGLKGAQARWQGYSKPIPKETEGNEREVKVSQDKETEMNQSETQATEKSPADSRSVNTVFSSALTSITARSAPACRGLVSQQLRFNERLKEIIRPRSESDLTCFHRLSQWLVKEITFKRFNEHIFRWVLDIARESAKGSRNPAAVFMSRLKKELGYKQ